MINKFHLSETSLSRLEGVDSRLVEVVKLAIQITKIDFGIPQDGGLRTAQRQNELFFNGKSKADGFTNRSKHQDGLAIDVFAYVDGKASWDEHHLTHIATAMLASASRLDVRMKWGGHWTGFVDMPHFELI